MVRINQTNNAPNFNGLYNNKHILNGLEYISEHGASFSTGVTLIGATLVRPLVISCTPKANKENKNAFTSESISSAISKFVVAQSVALPIEQAVKKIDKNPKEYLSEKTLKNLSQREYKFLTQTIKMASNLISAIPKSVFGVALIPVVGDILYKNKNLKKNKSSKQDTLINQKTLSSNSIFSGFAKDVNFTGVSKLIGNILNNDNVQKFAKKYSISDDNIAKNMSVATDVLLTASSVLSIKKNEKIKQEQKKPLVLNKILSSVLSVGSGCVVDKLIQEGTRDTIEKFSEIHKNSPKLSKYVEGINILRPTLIFAGIYYGIIPLISTFTSDKLSKGKSNQH